MRMESAANRVSLMKLRISDRLPQKDRVILFVRECPTLDTSIMKAPYPSRTIRLVHRWDIISDLWDKCGINVGYHLSELGTPIYFDLYLT